MTIKVIDGKYPYNGLFKIQSRFWFLGLFPIWRNVPGAYYQNLNLCHRVCSSMNEAYPDSSYRIIEVKEPYVG